MTSFNYTLYKIDNDNFSIVFRVERSDVDLPYVILY